MRRDTAAASVPVADPHSARNLSPAPDRTRTPDLAPPPPSTSTDRDEKAAEAEETAFEDDSTPTATAEQLQEVAAEVRREHVEFYEEKLGLSPSQKDVLDRFLAERQTVAGSPRIIVGLPQALEAFRQYLNSDQVRVYDTLVARDR